MSHTSQTAPVQTAPTTTISGVVANGTFRLKSQTVKESSKPRLLKQSSKIETSKIEKTNKYEEVFPSLPSVVSSPACIKSVKPLEAFVEDPDEKSITEAAVKETKPAMDPETKETAKEPNLCDAEKINAQNSASSDDTLSAVAAVTKVDIQKACEAIDNPAALCLLEGIDLHKLNEKQQRAAADHRSVRWYTPSGQFPLGHFRITEWTEDGALRHGLERFYTASGVLYHTINWVFGHRVGCESFFDRQSGELIRTVPWIRGPLCRQRSNRKRFYRRASRRHGVEQVFDGTYLYTEKTWRNGKRHGPETTVYVRTGVVLSERMWNNDLVHGEAIARWRNGDVKSRQHYNLGKKHGEQKFYTRNQKPCIFSPMGSKQVVVLSRSIQYNNGFRDGKEMHANGSVRHWQCGVLVDEAVTKQ